MTRTQKEKMLAGENVQCSGSRIQADLLPLGLG